MKLILNSYTLSELRKMISSKNIKKYSKLIKSELIELMIKSNKFNDVKMKEPNKERNKKDVRSLLNKKGHIYYYSEKGKLLVKENDSNKAYKQLKKLINENPSKFKSKLLIKMNFSYWDDNEYPIELTIEIIKVNFINLNNKTKLALNLRDDEHSLIRIKMKPNELNTKEFKKIGKLVLDNKLVDFTKTYKKYSYNDIKKLL
jgi:hypothetical protein